MPSNYKAQYLMISIYPQYPIMSYELRIFLSHKILCHIYFNEQDIKQPSLSVFMAVQRKRRFPSQVTPSN